MEFGLTPEQQMLVESLRAFVEKELIPHEELVERTRTVLRAIQRSPERVRAYSRPEPVRYAA